MGSVTRKHPHFAPGALLSHHCQVMKQPLNTIHSVAQERQECWTLPLYGQRDEGGAGWRLLSQRCQQPPDWLPWSSILSISCSLIHWERNLDLTCQGREKREYLTEYSLADKCYHWRLTKWNGFVPVSSHKFRKRYLDKRFCWDGWSSATAGKGLRPTPSAPQMIGEEPAQLSSKASSFTACWEGTGQWFSDEIRGAGAQRPGTCPWFSTHSLLCYASWPGFSEQCMGAWSPLKASASTRLPSTIS